MKANSESQWVSDQKLLKLRALLLAASAAIFWNELQNPFVVGGIGFLGLLNVAAWHACSKPHRYSAYGSRLMWFVRLIDTAVSVGAACYGPLQGENVWLFAVPVIISEAVASRSREKVGALAAAAVAIAITGEVLGFLKSGGAVTISMAAIASAAGAVVLGIFHARDEQLALRDSRLETVLECSSSLAGSTDLSTMMIATLKSAVAELGAVSGYIMLIDDDTPDELVTEAAYSLDGSFQFPDRLKVGVGLSGYAVKMGQPIALHDTDADDVHLEGVGSSAKAAVSIPLIARNFMGVGTASVERTVGALTLLSNAPHGFSKTEDLQVLQSIGSMVAVAVANSQMELRQRTTFLKTLESLAKSLEARDTYTQGHSQRVCDVSIYIGEELGLSAEALEELRVGTILHDIGKIGVPDQVLNKPGRLTDEEFEVMKSHPVIGYEICKPLMLSDGVLMIIRNHHEKLDGSGYPDGLKGGELPLSLRIVCVADAFDAMSSSRPYRTTMEMSKVLGELARGAGTQFDSVVVEALKNILSSERMHEIYADQWEIPEAQSA